MRNTDHTLHIQLSSCEGAIIRALGLMERRGYRLQTCTLNRMPDDRCVLDVMVESTRPGDLLKRQLERLVDVSDVILKAPARQQAVRRINVHARA